MRLSDELRAYVRFALGLRSFLQDRVDIGSVRDRVAVRLGRRERNLIDSVDRCVYSAPASPYRRLLEWAGCERGDFIGLVRSEGVEGALTTLRETGVFVTVDEFKIKRPIRRGSAEFNFRECDFENPLSKGTLVGRSGGSRSRGLRTVYDFRNLSDNWTAHFLLRFEVFGVLKDPIGIWYPIMPGAGPIVVLALARAGIFVKWFSPVTGRSLLRNLRSRCGNSFVVRRGKLADHRLAAPEFVPLETPDRIVRWIGSQLAESGRCTFMTYVSAAVRIAQAALRMGVDLSGTSFSVTSEPITAAKRKELEASGARVIPSYATMEAGTIAAGCHNPDSSDDMHVLNDTVAMTSYPRRIEHGNREVDTLLVSGLLDSFPKVLLNTETGDCGGLELRNCGCRFDELGFKWHLKDVFGFDKLTAGGMTFIGTDLVRILEEMLPERFGGTSLDYQLVEEEFGGQTFLCLIVNPSLGPLSEEAVKKVFLSELSSGSEANRLMSRVLESGNTFSVRRSLPSTTTRGKLLPLHLNSLRKQN